MNKMERFTQRARRVLSLAQEEAERMQHNYIGTEHMLLGLMREEGGVAGRVLRDLGLDQRRVEELVERMTPSGQRGITARLALSPNTKRLLELAVDEARRMGHHFIGTEHLLLGLVRWSDFRALEVFKRFNVSPEEIRRQTRRVLQESPVQPPAASLSTIHREPDQPLTEPSEKYAGQVLADVFEEATNRGHGQANVWHLILALLHRDSIAGRVLQRLHVDKERIETLLEISLADQPADALLAITPGVKQIMQTASLVASSLGSQYVGSEHILLATMREDKVAFTEMGLNLFHVQSVLAAYVTSLAGGRDISQHNQQTNELGARYEAILSGELPKRSEHSPEANMESSTGTAKGQYTDEKDIYRAVAEAEKAGQPVALATVVRTEGSMPRHAGSKLLVYADGRTVGTVGGGAMEARVVEEAKAAIKDGKPRINTYTLNDLKAGDPGVCGGTADIFIDPLFARPTLVIIGCGHVGKALAELAKWAGFRVIVSDDRGELCNPQHIPNMDGYIVTPPNAVHQHIDLGPNTFVAALTRGLPIDLDLFPPLLQANIPYLGLIGSRRRWTLTIKELEARGFTKEQLARVRAPIGLELEAETPKEIAVSILAEIIMLRNGGTGQPMQWMGSAESAAE